MNSVSVIGCGGWGSALAILLAHKGINVKLWSYTKEEYDMLQQSRENSLCLPGVKMPENIEFTQDMQYAVCDSEFIVSAVPSKAVRATCKNISKYIDVNKQHIINVSKGLDEYDFSRMSEVIRSEIDGVKLAVLSGPSHAEEVARCIPTTLVCAADTPELAEAVQDLFMCSYMRVYTCSDMAGVEYGGALKNVIALCAGILDGLGLGDNSKAALMTRGMTEISRLGVAMGADRETFFGLSGMGDLIVTCTSMHSRNRRAGILIGQGKGVKAALDEVKMVVEGVPAALAGYHLAKKVGVEMPITFEAYKVLFEDKNPRDALMSLMTRQRRHETEVVF